MRRRESRLLDRVVWYANRSGRFNVKPESDHDFVWNPQPLSPADDRIRFTRSRFDKTLWSSVRRSAASGWSLGSGWPAPVSVHTFAQSSCQPPSGSSAA